MTAFELSQMYVAGTGQVTCRNYSRLGYDRLIRGVYGHTPRMQGMDEWEQRRTTFIARTRAVMAAYAGKEAFLFGNTALQVLGVALPTRLEDWDTCHILVPKGVTRPVRVGVVAHRSIYPLRQWALAYGLPVLNPVEHWLQLSGASVDEMIEVGDGFLRRRQPLLSLDTMNAALASYARRQGVARATEAMKWVRPNTDSLYETITRLVLVHAGLPEPTVNLEVHCPSSGMTYHLDMGYDKEKVGVEYDGAVHVGDRTQMEIDANRRRILQDEGWLIITVTAAQLRTPEQVVRSVESALILRRSAMSASW